MFGGHAFDSVTDCRSNEKNQQTNQPTEDDCSWILHEKLTASRLAKKILAF
jgi:hypothetical protein